MQDFRPGRRAVLGLLDLVNTGRIRPVETDSCDTAADFVRTKKGGERTRNAGQHALFGVRRGALSSLDAFPLLLHGRRRPDPFAARIVSRQPASGWREHMRVAANQLRRDGVNRVAKLERSRFGPDLRVKHDLKQHVAELLDKCLDIACVERVERLVGFLDQVGPQRPMRLLAIPRAASRRAQSVSHPHELLERFRRPPPACAGALTLFHASSSGHVVIWLTDYMAIGYRTSLWSIVIALPIPRKSIFR